MGLEKVSTPEPAHVGLLRHGDTTSGRTTGGEAAIL